MICSLIGEFLPAIVNGLKVLDFVPAQAFDLARLYFRTDERYVGSSGLNQQNPLRNIVLPSVTFLR